jgi:hypothetical protein
MTKYSAVVVIALKKFYVGVADAGPEDTDEYLPIRRNGYF